MKNSDVSCSNKASDTINAIFSFKNLYKAYEDCTKGVKWKYSTQNYMVNAVTRIARVRKHILNGTYKNGKPRYFTVCERGKTRKINALPFQDRVVHKCLCDNYLTPLLSSSLIYDCGATLKGKGLSFTRNRLVAHLQQYWRKHRNKGYVLKIDLHNYFESIDRDILFDKFEKIIKNQDTLSFIKGLVPTNIKGLGLGSQISQISALYYLNDVDHHIKEKLKIKFYGRYMDDFYLIHESKYKLKHALQVIIDLLKKLQIEISKHKTHITKLKNGFVFCKTRYYITRTGKVLRFVASHSIRSFQRKIKMGIDLKASLKSYLLYFNKSLIYNYLERRNSIYEILQKQT